MILRRALFTLIFASVSSIAIAQMSTNDEAAACRPDVRKYCYKIPQNAGNQAFQACLESNIQVLSQKCKQVLMGHQPQ